MHKRHARWFSLFALLCLLLAAPSAGAPPPTGSDDALAAGGCSGVSHTAIAIPDVCANPAISGILVACPDSAGKTISRLRVSYDITHPCMDNLRIELWHSIPTPPYWLSTVIFNGDGGICHAGAPTLPGVVNAFNGALAEGTYVLQVFDCAPTQTGTLNSWFVAVDYDNPPAVLSSAPASGHACSGVVQSFQTLFNDADGASDLDAVEFLFDQGNLAKVNQVYLRYSRRLNKLYMRNAANTAWLGDYAPGDNQVIETALARLHVKDTTVTLNGNALAVNWAIEFLPPYAGKSYRQMLYASDIHGSFSGWENMGNWAVSCAPLGASIQLHLPLLLRNRLALQPG